MKLPISWIKEYIALKWPTHQIAKALTAAGLEVESIETMPLKFNKVVVAKVLKTEKHPNADKLCVATVTDGVNTLQVVCGAPNCRAGLKTALALVGGQVKDFQIKQAKIRGVESFGMLCSASELGLSVEDQGIIEFEEHLQEGTDLAELFGEQVLDISLTPNLGHCSSVLGVARELSASSGIPLHYPRVAFKESNETIARAVEVTVEDLHNCPRYTCRLIKNVRVGPSPDWLQKKLVAAGLRPINNIVDVTNFVLLEMGHPLHAFDLDKLSGKKIIVRQAKREETIETLDGKTRTLFEGDLLICDEAKPVAIAGVMGGLNSEVSAQTTHVLIESAYFRAGAIRKTSKRLGLQTDASKRFERGTDPNGLVQALDRAVMLICDVAGGEIVHGIIDVKEKEFPELAVSCRVSRANAILGTHLSVSEVENVFQRLNFSYNWDGIDTFIVHVPTYRTDVHAEIDLIEEVARIYGYDHIGIETPRYTSSPIQNTAIFDFERVIRARLLSEGLQEFLNCDLIGPTIVEKVKEGLMPEETFVQVMNPVSIEQSILRTSLMPGLLELVKYNWDHQNQNIAGFEIGRIHFKEAEHFKEQAMVGIVLSGKTRPNHWDIKPREFDFFDLKGIIENLLTELGITNCVYENSLLGGLHGGRQASVFVDSLELGSLGEVHPEILRRLDMPQRILYAELNLYDLIQKKKTDFKMSPLAIYPSSERDWTLTLSQEVPAQVVFNTIKAYASPYLENVALLDVFTGEKIGAEFKNITFRFTYRDQDKTISQETVEVEHAKTVASVSKELKLEDAN